MESIVELYSQHEGYLRTSRRVGWGWGRALFALRERPPPTYPSPLEVTGMDSTLTQDPSEGIRFLYLS